MSDLLSEQVKATAYIHIWICMFSALVRCFTEDVQGNTSDNCTHGFVWLLGESTLNQMWQNTAAELLATG